MLRVLVLSLIKDTVLNVMAVADITRVISSILLTHLCCDKQTHNNVLFAF